LFPLPCACQNLRRLTRMVTRIYDQELRKAGLEVTQYGLLTALATAGEGNQKRIGAGLAIDSTTLTRNLGLLARVGLVRTRRGRDRRERIYGLTPAGRRQMVMARPHWERARRILRRRLGPEWDRMEQAVASATAALAARP